MNLSSFSNIWIQCPASSPCSDHKTSLFCLSVIRHMQCARLKINFLLSWEDFLISKEAESFFILLSFYLKTSNISETNSRTSVNGGYNVWSCVIFKDGKSELMKGERGKNKICFRVKGQKYPKSLVFRNLWTRPLCPVQWRLVSLSFCCY